MRRSLLAAALLLGVIAGFVPRAATADHCNRVIVLSGFGVPVNNPTTNQPVARPRADAGTAACTAHGAPRLIAPGSTIASVRVTKAANEPVPVAGTVTIGETTTPLELTPNAEDPSKATLFDSQVLPIDYTKVTKIVAEVTYANGTTQQATYTRQ